MLNAQSEHYAVAVKCTDKQLAAAANDSADHVMKIQVRQRGGPRSRSRFGRHRHRRRSQRPHARCSIVSMQCAIAIVWCLRAYVPSPGAWCARAARWALLAQALVQQRMKLLGDPSAAGGKGSGRLSQKAFNERNFAAGSLWC